MSQSQTAARAMAAPNKKPARAHRTRHNSGLKDKVSLALVAVGALGVSEVPILVLLQAPPAAYPIVGAVATAAITTLGFVFRRQQ